MSVTESLSSSPDSDLPEGWDDAQLEGIAEQIQYGYTASATKGATGPRFLRITDIQNGKVDWGAVPTCQINRRDLQKYALRLGDIVFARTGATTGKSYLIRSRPSEAVFASYLIRLRLRDGVDPTFVSLFFNTPDYWQYISENVAGNAQPNCNATKLGALRVPLPPLAEQKRIVENAERLLAHVNAARERLARVPTILQRFRQAVLAASCSGRLTADWRNNNAVESVETTLKRIHVSPSKTGREATDNIISGTCILSVGNPCTAEPNGWKWTLLTAIARLESGHTPSRKHPEYWDGDIPWIGIVDAGASHGDTILRTNQTVTQKGLDNSAARLLPPGTVCLSRTASVGYVVVMGRFMATSQDFVNWVCSEALVPKFLMYALMAEGDEIRRFGRGTTHTTIYFPEVKAIHICLPPVEEQREIVRRINDLFMLAETIEKRVTLATASADRLTQAILTKAFRGELVPTEAELARREGRSYESAAALLARIRAAGAASSNNGAPSKQGRRRAK